MTGSPVRPPGADDTRPCEAINARGEKCGNPSSWLVPEYPFCGLHRIELPPPMLVVRERRIVRWNEEAAKLWQRILRDESPDAEAVELWERLQKVLER